MPKNGRSSGRDAGTELVEHVRQAIHSGKFPADRFLPTVRELGEKFKASPETVRRGLKSLEAEGLLIARARHGFRVARRAEGTGALGPVAYVMEYGQDMAGAQPANWALNEALQTAAAARGSAVLTTPCGGQSRAAVLDRLRAGHASGIILDTLDASLIDTIRQAGLPVVMVNSWWEETEFDVVLQDNYRGGFLAAKHLMDSGCRKIAWVGEVGEFCHSRERFAGAMAALVAAGRRPVDLACVQAPNGPELLARALDALASSDRPDGILALSGGGAMTVRDACASRGIEIGKDLRLVGWVVEECYAREFASAFRGGLVPPAIVWKASSMAEQALARLAERRQGKAGEPVRICVPTRLKVQ